jgi:dTMP kinase
MTILMDSEVGDSVARARRRNQTSSNGVDESRFERESRGFFERVQKGYRAIAEREPRRVLVVDARRTAEVVHKDILAAVRERVLAVKK